MTSKTETWFAPNWHDPDEPKVVAYELEDDGGCRAGFHRDPNDAAEVIRRSLERDAQHFAHVARHCEQEAERLFTLAAKYGSGPIPEVEPGVYAPR